MTALVGSSGTQTAGASDTRESSDKKGIESVLEARIRRHGGGEDQGVPCRPSSGGLWETSRSMRKTLFTFQGLL